MKAEEDAADRVARSERYQKIFEDEKAARAVAEAAQAAEDEEAEIAAFEALRIADEAEAVDEEEADIAQAISASLGH